MMSRASSIMTGVPTLSRRETPSAGPATCLMELMEHTIDQVGRGRRRIGVFVVQIHGLPFEGTELMEGLHLDPLDVLHRRDEFRDTLDIRRIVSQPRHERK